MAFMGDHVIGQVSAKSHGSDGASPYLPRSFSCSSSSSIFDRRQPSDSRGSHHRAGKRQKPRFGRSLTLPSALVLVLVLVLDL